MPYVDLAGLSRFAGKSKDFASSACAGPDMANWQRTAAAGAVSFSPVPEMPLDPVVNFLFSETGPASGTKSPDNPSTITGVSSITVTRCETVGVDSTDYTIDLGGTYYGGSVDVSAGTMTVTWGGLILDGTENWVAGTSGTYYRYIYTQEIKSTFSLLQSCTHYNFASGTATNTQYFNLNSAGTLAFSTTQTSVSDFKTWLAEQRSVGTPVTVVATLATPFTVQLTPTQIYSLSQPDSYTPRINTVYSDQVSVQVGYPKSPQATQNELTNAVVSLGGNV